MTLSVVSSNEDAQQSSTTPNTMEATGSNEGELRLSQDSGYGGCSQPGKFLGQNLRITASANQGGRKYMEDRVHVRVHRNADTGVIEWTYVAVYDGHGGPEASEYCRQHLLKNIMAEKGFDSEDDEEFLDAIRNGYLKTHHTMWREVDTWTRTASGYPSTAGTTASCAFIRRGKVYVGHVGDSAILLTTRTKPDKFYRLTEDHKPETPTERRRIEASGGQIMQKQCVYRVVWTRAGTTHVGPIRRSTPTQTIPFLAVARALGDFWSYVESTQEFAVSPIPDVSVTTLTPEHHALVLASDGLTNVVSAELEAAIMYDLAQEEREKTWFRDANEQPNHARILMRRTMLNWRKFRADNISVLTVIFGDDQSESGCSSPASSEHEEHMLEETPLIEPPVEEDRDECVDALLVEHPMCMMHVTNEKLMRYATAPVTLRYNGHFDNNFFGVDSVGPGFISHVAEGERVAALPEEEAERAERLQQYYDCLGRGERDVTPENQPPATSTANLTNTATPAAPVATATAAAAAGGAAAVERPKSPPVFTSAAAIIIDQLRRGGEATAAAAASAAAAAAAAEVEAGDRPTTPPNRPDTAFAVLRARRSSAKRKSRILVDETESDTSGPSSSRASDDDAAEESEEDRAADMSIVEESESEGAVDDSDDAVLRLALPFADQRDENERMEEAGAREELAMRTPSPIGDAAEGSQTVPATPVCNTTATEREVVRRVTRSVAATTSASSQREMVLVDRPATRRSHARRLLADPAALSSPATVATTVSSPYALRTPKMVLEVDEHNNASIATRTRSRNGEVTPPGCSSNPVTSASGSRKRPRTSTTAATPLLAKISLAEMNENADSSMESSGDAVTAPKAATGTPSKWKRVNRQPLGPGAL